MHMIFGIFALAFLVGATLVLFGVWFLVASIRMLGRLVFGSGGRKTAGGQTTACNRQGCHSPNPANARFCRRCGVDLQTGLSSQMRHEVWDAQRAGQYRAMTG